MLKNLARALITLVGVSLGFGLGILVERSVLVEDLLGINLSDTITAMVVNISFALIFGLLFYFSSSWMVKKIVKLADQTENELTKIPFNQMMSSLGGLIAGLLIAFLLNPLLSNLVGETVLSMAVTVFVYGILGYLGVRLGNRYLGDPYKLKENMKNLSVKQVMPLVQSQGAKAKVLDTSVIIDGRIADIAKTGFIEGPLVIATFVLDELRHIADSSDELKRVRGRRGLDILNVIQKDLQIEVVITDEDFDDVSEVDMKLLKLAQKRQGAVVTNDFNLNKVAEIQGVQVLNINDLANAVKSVVIPGEEMFVSIVKEGKESHQGVAYLDDGTMIVIEEGRKLIGNNVQVVVTSVLQTSAGRMIFAKPKGKAS